MSVCCMILFSWLTMGCQKHPNSAFEMADVVIQTMNAEETTPLLSFFPDVSVVQSLIQCKEDRDIVGKMEEAKIRVEEKQRQYQDRFGAMTLISIAITKQRSVKKGEESGECMAQSDFQMLRIQSTLQSGQDPSITGEVNLNILYAHERYYLFDM